MTQVTIERELLERARFLIGVMAAHKSQYVERDSVYEAIEAILQAAPAQPKRPINCGTGHCSCIECVMEPAQPLNQVLVDALEKIANETRNIGSAHILARAALAQAQAQPAQGLTDVAELQKQMREVAELAHANPGKAFPIPLLVQIEGKKMMAGEPSLFDQIAFSEVKALGDLTTSAIQKGQQS